MEQEFIDTIGSCALDEYSIQDAISALAREHAISWQDAKNILLEGYEQNLFKLYKDCFDNGRHKFIELELSKIDFARKNIKMIYLTAPSPD